MFGENQSIKMQTVNGMMNVKRPQSLNVEENNVSSQIGHTDDHPPSGCKNEYIYNLKTCVHGNEAGKSLVLGKIPTECQMNYLPVLIESLES